MHVVGFTDEPHHATGLTRGPSPSSGRGGNAISGTTEGTKVDRTKGITWLLLAVWAVFAVLFVIKLRNASLHPLQNHDPGGLLFLISQAALAAAMLLMWQLRKKDA